ncbi:MAG: DUF1727 domain-containing protein [Clostridia bacterium]|nr:DUF1727 domain-containing protein [Clostridia bacterium]
MRKLIAIWIAKLSAIAGRLVGKNSSAGPGTIALKICPDLIERLQANIKGKVIAVCGTNGKTTTNNLIYSALKKSGYSVLCNNLGANMLSGVATAFALRCNWLGNFKADFACFEIDEASAPKVFRHIKPDYIVVTNLFRDQLDRYGEIEHTVELIKNAIQIADKPVLVLNGDDPISASFGISYDNAVYFGIGEAVLPQSTEVKEGRFCTVCGEEQKYNFIHYGQLGDYYCPNCNNKRPNIDFEAKNVDLSDGISFSVLDEKIQLNYRGFYNIYNVLAVYSLLKAMNIEIKSFSTTLQEYKPQTGRMEEFNIGKKVILNLAKNPAGFNQAIATVLQDPRKKDIIFAINDKPGDGLDVSWLWDVDFDKILHSGLNTVSLSGIRRYDLALRFKYDEIPFSAVSEDMRMLIENCLRTDAEVCYILVNYTALFSTKDILSDIEKQKGIGEKND